MEEKPYWFSAIKEAEKEWAESREAAREDNTTQADLMHAKVKCESNCDTESKTIECITAGMLCVC